MPAIPVVKVKNDKAKDGFMLINECDFVEGDHALYEQKEKPKAKAKAKAKKVVAKKPAAKKAK